MRSMYSLGLLLVLAFPQVESGELTSRTVGQFFIKKDALLLVILWRGEPGWTSRGGKAGSSGRGGVTATGEIDDESHYGNVTLSWHYSDGTHRLLIRGQEVSIDTANVIVVDRVDSVGGPPRLIALRRRLTLPSRPPGHGRDWVGMLRRLPDVGAYVRYGAL
jgi:hypothetical protein